MLRHCIMAMEVECRGARLGPPCPAPTAQRLHGLHARRGGAVPGHGAEAGPDRQRRHLGVGTQSYMHSLLAPRYWNAVARVHNDVCTGNVARGAYLLWLAVGDTPLLSCRPLIRRCYRDGSRAMPRRGDPKGRQLRLLRCWPSLGGEAPLDVGVQKLRIYSHPAKKGVPPKIFTGQTRLSYRRYAGTL